MMIHQVSFKGRRLPGGGYAVACCAIVLLCWIVANPFARAGFNDDWSYADVALKFAQTGRVQYNGWGAPMLLVQALWGAAWIRLFGFSFDVLRLATLPFALGFVWLVYALGRKLALRPDLACFGALLVGTSPVFIPISLTFMTDVYGCFFTTLCLYAVVSCLRARDRKSYSSWLWILAMAGLIGGSDRQIVWVAPLTLIPYLSWLRRLDRRLLLQAFGAYGLCVVGIVLLSRVFTPRYEPFDVTRQQVVGLVVDNALVASFRLLSLFLVLHLILLPALLCLTPLWKKLGIARVLIFLTAASVSVFCLKVLLGEKFIVPFLGNLVTPFGVLNLGYDAIGPKPLLLSTPVRVGLTILVVFSAFAYYCLRRDSPNSLETGTKRAFLIFSAGYTVLLIPGALVGLTFDRYAIPFMPILIAIILRRFQSYGRKIPVSAWTCLFIFCVFGVVTTHDYSSALRARLVAAQRLEASGIPQRNVSAGLEYDGWTQLKLTGQIEGTVYGDRFAEGRSDAFWLWHYATALQPRYVTLYSLSPNLPRNSVLQVPYSAWAPPFRRAVVVMRREDLFRR